jgi:uncharacterized protein YjbI with pentapeptide repeats
MEHFKAFFAEYHDEMAPRGPRPQQIGAAQAPEFVTEELEDCVLTGADFQGASIKATVFSRCQLVEADFSKAAMSLVDLRGSELRLAGSLLGLRGAIIDPLQLMELSGTLAQELGITVEDI